MEKCLICKFPSKDFDKSWHTYHFDCYRCGKYSISSEAYEDFDDYINNENQRANLSGWIRENQNEFISSERLARLSKLVCPSVDEKANRVLLYLSKIYPIPGQQLPEIYNELRKLIEQINSSELPPNNEISANNLLPLFSIAYTSSLDEIYYIIYDYLFHEQNYLNLDGIEKITPRGWAFIESYKMSNPESNIVFIAMKFEDSLKEFSEKWVETAVRESGFEPIRIDKYEHNNLIDDEIIANIRRSRFLIADLTGNSYGVYFEAGFARGMDIPVIYLCREDYFKSDEHKVHFDTNHYSFILWDENKGIELKTKLRNRIEATIGRGAYSE